MSNIYSGIKSFLPQVHSFAKKGAGFYKEGKNYIKELVDHASTIPFIGGALKSGAEALYKKQISVPVIGSMSAEEIVHYLDMASDLVNDENISSLAQQADAIISPAVQAGDRYMSGDAASAPSVVSNQKDAPYSNGREIAIR